MPFDELESVRALRRSDWPGRDTDEPERDLNDSSRVC